MKHYRLHETNRFDEAGGMAHGTMMVGDDKIVRWFTHSELRETEGIGVYSGAIGYCVYDDEGKFDIPRPDARLAFIGG